MQKDKSIKNSLLIKSFEEKTIDTRDILALNTIPLQKHEETFIHSGEDDVVYVSNFDVENSTLVHCSVLSIVSDDKVKVYLNREKGELILYEGVIKNPMVVVTTASRYDDIYIKGKVHVTKYHVTLKTLSLFSEKEVTNKQYSFKHCNNCTDIIEK